MAHIYKNEGRSSINICTRWEADPLGGSPKKKESYFIMPGKTLDFDKIRTLKPSATDGDNFQNVGSTPIFISFTEPHNPNEEWLGAFYGIKTIAIAPKDYINVREVLHLKRVQKR